MMHGFRSAPQSVHPARWVAVLVLAVLPLACDKVSSVFKRTPLPDMGPRMANSVKLTFDRSFSDLKMEYKDGCNSPHELLVGAEVESVLIDAAVQNFQAVSVTGGTAAPVPPDTEILISLQRSGLKLWADNVYDRVPADLTVDALLTFKDMAGKELGQQTVAVTHNQRLILEPTARRCEFGNIDEFLHDTGVAVATQFIRAARTQLAGTSAPAPALAKGAPKAAPTPPLATKPTAPSGRHTLSFKATVLDENSNLLFEGGERIRVRVDVVNGGDQDLQRVTASLSGTPTLLTQFPTTTLTAGRLQPGQSRSLEFIATLPQGVQPQKAEIHVAVSDPDSESPPPQVLSLSIQPTGMRADDVDQIPAAATDFKRPNTYLLSVGIGSYRDQQLSLRRYGASDAEMVATYFQSLGGLPAANVRLLQDWKALRPDIDEALLDWLPAHMNRESVVVVYFAGVASVSSAGEVFLLPYDAGTGSTSRAYPLKDLEAALARLKAKQTIVLFDGAVSRVGADSKGKLPSPRWSQSVSGATYVLSTAGLGRSLEDEKHRHGLFTYYLLRALRGESDTNRDGEVTLGEAVSYVSQKVLWASKTQHGTEQRAAILPPLKTGDQASGLVLTKLAAIRAIETP